MINNFNFKIRPRVIHDFPNKPVRESLPRWIGRLHTLNLHLSINEIKSNPVTKEPIFQQFILHKKFCAFPLNKKS